MELLRSMIVEEYIYDNEKEKEQHKKEMELNGWEDSGKMQMNINGSYTNPDNRWYGRYYKES